MCEHLVSTTSKGCPYMQHYNTQVGACMVFRSWSMYQGSTHEAHAGPTCMHSCMGLMETTGVHECARHMGVSMHTCQTEGSCLQMWCVCVYRWVWVSVIHVCAVWDVVFASVCLSSLHLHGCIQWVRACVGMGLEIFWHIIPHLSYKANQESRESVENLLRYNYFLPQVSFEQFCCRQLMSEKCQNCRLLLRCQLMSHD